MQTVTTLAEATQHQVHATLRRLVGGSIDEPAGGRDRGAVSLEQVLWYVAAGVSVAIIAAILWGQIRSTAETPVTPPATP